MTHERQDELLPMEFKDGCPGPALIELDGEVTPEGKAAGYRIEDKAIFFGEPRRTGGPGTHLVSAEDVLADIRSIEDQIIQARGDELYAAWLSRRPWEV